MTTTTRTTETHALINDHVDMARRMARSVARNVPHEKRDELESAALLGLTEAALRYDPTRGEPFGAFAVQRVRGAVLDELRKTDLLSRRARRMARQVEEVVTNLALQLGREPSNDEVAGRMGISISQIAGARDCQARQVPLESAEAVMPGQSPDPVARIQKRQELAALENAMAGLSERERSVIDLYYREGLKLKEIGERLGVTESRVSQLRSAAIRSLRQLVRTDRPVNDGPACAAAQ